MDKTKHSVLLAVLCLVGASVAQAEQGDVSRDNSGVETKQAEARAEQVVQGEPSDHEKLLDQLHQLIIKNAENTRIDHNLRGLVRVLLLLKPETRSRLALWAASCREDGTIDLTRTARVDLKKGRLNLLEVGGLPHPRHEDFRTQLKAKYGVSLLVFGMGCTTPAHIERSVNEYNEIVQAHLAQQYPGFSLYREWDIFNKADQDSKDKEDE